MWRLFEATPELELRRAAEAKLADALGENQRLAQQYLEIQEERALSRSPAIFTTHTATHQRDQAGMQSRSAEAIRTLSRRRAPCRFDDR